MRLVGFVVVRPINVKLVEANPNVPAGAVATGVPPTPGQALQFTGYLARKHSLTGDLLSKLTSINRPGAEKRLRELWELTDLSADAFADEVAHFFKLPRVDLPQLLAASSLTASLSRRFLREMTVFPCRLKHSSDNTLVVADPTDVASVRATELTLGGPVSLAIASFEDIGTALTERLGSEERARRTRGRTNPFSYGQRGCREPTRSCQRGTCRARRQ